MLHTSRYIYIYTYFLLICDLKVDDRPETWIAYACMINIYKYCMDIALKCLLLFIIIRKKILKWRAPLFSAELEWTEACWAVNDTTRKCAQVLSPKVRATIPDSVWHSRIPLGTAGFRWAQPDPVGHSPLVPEWAHNLPFPTNCLFWMKVRKTINQNTVAQQCVPFFLENCNMNTVDMTLVIARRHVFSRPCADSRRQENPRLRPGGVFQSARQTHSSASDRRLCVRLYASRDPIPRKAYFTNRKHTLTLSSRTFRHIVANAATPLKQTFDTETGGYSRDFLLVRVAVFLR